jgi:thiamine kinase-like enzyme
VFDITSIVPEGEMSAEKIKGWVHLAMKNEDLLDYTITLEGKSSKADGYLGNIIFITVVGKTKAGQNKSFNLVVKSSKESSLLRQQTPIKEAFDKEIYIYNTVLPAFRKFQKERTTVDILNFLPRCYATQTRENREILILEDLKKKGFEICDRTIPMTYEHIKLVLQSFGKWHAYSFALKKAHQEIFEKLVENNVNMFSYFIVKVGLQHVMLKLFKEARDGSIYSKEVELLKELQFSEDDVNKIFIDLFFEDPEYRVISHGDCWSGNFMFQYQEDKTRPTSVGLLDWQCSGLSSPVMDLSHFIYGCNDTGKHKDVKESLEIYYESFSECLSHLGYDSGELFPYSKLLEHWKRFARYGLFLQPFVVKFSLCDADDAPDFVEAAEEGKQFLENFNVDIKNEEIYFKRVRDNFVHYVKNLNL